MKKLLTFGLFLAAGYGTYEILRRAGLLDKAGQWLQDNVPEDVKTKVRDHVQQAREQAQTLRGQAQEQIGSLKGQAQEQFQNLKTRAADGYSAARDQAGQIAKQAGERYEQARETVTNKIHGYTETRQQPVSANESMQPPVAEEGDSVHSTDASGIGQTITGPGRGADDETADANGTTVHHRVGRGVVR